MGAEAGPGAVETLAGLDEVDWVVLREPTAFPALVSREYELDFGDHQEGRRTAEELLRDHGPFDTVVDLLDVGGGKALGREAGRVGLLQVLVRHSLTGGLRLVHLTRGVVSVPSPTDPVVPAVTGARMASLVRSLGAEYAAVQAVTIDTDTPAEDLGALLTLALSESAAHTSQVCYREGVRYQPALVPVDAAPVEGGDSLGGFRVEPDRAYLVTGGTGAWVSRPRNCSCGAAPGAWSSPVCGPCPHATSGTQRREARGGGSVSRPYAGWKPPGLRSCCTRVR